MFGLVWQSFVVLNVGDSLENEYARVGIQRRGFKELQVIGVGMCICESCVLVPVRPIKDLILTVGFVLWIAYWFRIANFTRALGARATVATAPPIG